MTALNHLDLDAIGDRFENGRWTPQDVAALFVELQRRQEVIDELSAGRGAMDGPAHYRLAEDLIARLDVYDGTDPTSQAVIANQVAEAQVHATLAVAAATAATFVGGGYEALVDTQDITERAARDWMSVMFGGAS